MQTMTDLTTRSAPNWATMSSDEQSKHWARVRAEAQDAIDHGADEHEVELALWRHTPPERKMRADVTVPQE